jgi:hypothetical protein
MSLPEIFDGTFTSTDATPLTDPTPAETVALPDRREVAVPSGAMLTTAGLSELQVRAAGFSIGFPLASNWSA